MLAGAGIALGAGVTSAFQSTTAAAVDGRDAVKRFRYCLNTGTIRGHKLDLPTSVELVARAGYSGIEPWVREIDAYAKAGGSLSDLGKRISDLGLTVESAIGFSQWIIDDDDKRAAALEQAKREMDLVRQIGGTRIAAPPAGATKQTGMNLFDAAGRYRALLEAGASIGIVPQVEVWGFSKTLGRLGEAVFVAIESGHREACVLPDVYHVYKGGSEFTGLKMLSGNAIHVFHVNDYPTNPPRDKVSDADRVYPGDGDAPLDDIFRTLRDIGFHGALSLELFNRDYWAQDVNDVLKAGLDKTRAAVDRALG